MKVIFVRHGLTDTNVKIAQGEATAEDDAPLNEEGLRQAKDVALKLKDEAIDAIFTSPLRRAKETAAEIARYHNAPIIEESGLRERNGGKLSAELWHELFDFDKKLQLKNFESVDAFFQRVYNAIDHIKGSEYENVVIVSHGGVYHAARAYFGGLEWKGNMRVDRLGNCEYREFEIDK